MRGRWSAVRAVILDIDRLFARNDRSHPSRRKCERSFHRSPVPAEGRTLGQLPDQPYDVRPGLYCACSYGSKVCWPPHPVLARAEGYQRNPDGSGQGRAANYTQGKEQPKGSCRNEGQP